MSPLRLPRTLRGRQTVECAETFLLLPNFKIKTLKSLPKGLDICPFPEYN